MKVIGLASDHAGFKLKEYVKQWLEAKGWEYKLSLIHISEPTRPY